MVKNPPSRASGTLTPGFYTLRLVPRGWPIPAWVKAHTGPEGAFHVTVNGEDHGYWSDPAIEAAVLAWVTNQRPHIVAKLIMFGRQTTEQDYRYREAMRAWAQTHNPAHPAANPTVPMNPNLLPADDF